MMIILFEFAISSALKINFHLLTKTAINWHTPFLHSYKSWFPETKQINKCKFFNIITQQFNYLQFESEMFSKILEVEACLPETLWTAQGISPAEKMELHETPLGLLQMRGCCRRPESTLQPEMSIITQTCKQGTHYIDWFTQERISPASQQTTPCKA